MSPHLSATLYSQPLAVRSIAFSPDSETLASGGEDGTITLWNVSTGQPIGEPLTGHTDWFWSVAFSPDGQTLASGSQDYTIRLWDVSTGQPIGNYSRPPLPSCSDVVSWRHEPC